MLSIGLGLSVLGWYRVDVDSINSPKIEVEKIEID